MITEMKFQELMNKNMCPAEYVHNTEGAIIPYDCEGNHYDCRKCVEEFIYED